MGNTFEYFGMVIQTCYKIMLNRTKKKKKEKLLITSNNDFSSQLR